MSFSCRDVSVCWATKSFPLEGMPELALKVQHYAAPHWSRPFEYPWAFLQGKFGKGEWVLDAAGGDGFLQHMITKVGAQVINVDLDVDSQPKVKGVIPLWGDLTRLDRFSPEVFDRVACVSVLEHSTEYLKIVSELWRVLKRGGRLVMTWDVASYARHNHAIDFQGAKRILSMFGVMPPTKPNDTLGATFPELDDNMGGCPSVDLNVLCLAATKG